MNARRYGWELSAKLALVAGLTFLLAACGGGGGGGGKKASPASTVTRQAQVPPGAKCPTGGVEIFYGIDDNRNGKLDDAEIDGSEIICNGTAGEPGAPGDIIATLRVEAIGSNLDTFSLTVNSEPTASAVQTGPADQVDTITVTNLGTAGDSFEVDINASGTPSAYIQAGLPQIDEVTVTAPMGGGTTYTVDLGEGVASYTETSPVAQVDTVTVSTAVAGATYAINVGDGAAIYVAAAAVAQVDTITITAQANTTYEVDINTSGIPASFGGTGQTVAQIANGLATAISSAFGTVVTAASDGVNTITVTANIAGTPFTMTLTEGGSPPVSFSAVATTPNQVADTTTDIAAGLQAALDAVSGAGGTGRVSVSAASNVVTITAVTAGTLFTTDVSASTTPGNLIVATTTANVPADTANDIAAGLGAALDAISGTGGTGTFTIAITTNVITITHNTADTPFATTLGGIGVANLAATTTQASQPDTVANIADGLAAQITVDFSATVTAVSDGIDTVFLSPTVSGTPFTSTITLNGVSAAAVMSLTSVANLPAPTEADIAFDLAAAIDVVSGAGGTGTVAPTYLPGTNTIVIVAPGDASLTLGGTAGANMTLLQ